MNGFLDVQSEFDLHDLQEIVKNTKLFVCLVTKEIFDSAWCLKGTAEEVFKFTCRI